MRRETYTGIGCSYSKVSNNHRTIFNFLLIHSFSIRSLTNKWKTCINQSPNSATLLLFDAYF